MEQAGRLTERWHRVALVALMALVVTAFAACTDGDGGGDDAQESASAEELERHELEEAIEERHEILTQKIEL